MSAARQKLEQLLSRVQSRRRVGPRTMSVVPTPAEAAGDSRIAAVPSVSRASAAPLALEIMPEPSTAPPAAPNVFDAPTPAPLPPPPGPVLSLEPPSGVVVERRPSLPTPLEDAMGQLGPLTPFPGSGPSTAPPRQAPVVSAPSMDLELVELDDVEAASQQSVAIFSMEPPAAPQALTSPPEFDLPPPSAAPPAVAQPMPALTDLPSLPSLPSMDASSPVVEVAAPARAAEPTFQRVQPPAMLAGASPVAVVSSAKVSAAPTFRALVERSLALRPRR